MVSYYSVSNIPTSRKLKTAAVWLMAAGVVIMTAALLAALVLWILAEGVSTGFGQPSDMPLWIIVFSGVIAALPGVVSIIGGSSALKKRRWRLALAASVVSIIYLNVLAVPAAVLLLLSKTEFKNSGNPADQKYD